MAKEKTKLVSTEMSVSELNAKIAELESELFKLRLQKGTGQLEKTALLKLTRKNIARAKTFVTQKAKGLNV